MKNTIEIEWSKKAFKQVATLPYKARHQVYNGVQSLRQWPETLNVKALQGRNDYRLRIGRYRALFTIHPDGTVTVIRIEEVKKRDEHTY